MIKKRLTNMVLVVALVISVVIPAHAATLFSDNFSSGSAQWSLSDGSKITLVDYAGSKMLYLNGTTHAKTLTATAGKLNGDITFESDFSLASNGGYFGWYICYSPVQDYLLQLYPSGDLKFLKRTKAGGSAYTELSSTSVSISRQDIHTMKITFVAGTMTAYVDGAMALQATDNELKGGAIGFRTLSGDMYCGNVTVTDGTAGGSTTVTQPSVTQPSTTQPHGGLLYSDNFDAGMRGYTVEKNPTSFTGEAYNGSGKLKFTDLKNKLDAGVAVTGDIAWADYSVEMSMIPATLRYMGVLFRYHNIDNHYLLQFYGTGAVKLLKKVNGSLYTVIANSKCNLKRGETYKVSVTAVGGKITASVDGVTLFNVYDDSLKNGKVGFRGMNSVFYVDDISVSSK